MKIRVLLFFFGIFLLWGGTARAQELVNEKVETLKARVVEVLEQDVKTVPGTDVESTFQKLRVEIIEGKDRGKEVIVDNDYLNLKIGETFYLRHMVDELDNRELYSVADPYRLPEIIFFIAFFILSVLIFGGLPGIRGLLSLLASFLFIYYMLLPGILAGYSPVLVSIGVSSLIIILGSYITHGFNKMTSSAVIGMIITVIFTGILSYIAVETTRLTGFASEEAIYLNFDTRGAINFPGLLLGGILIGLLGVLYDAAIGQSIAVEELNRAGPHLPRSYILKRALRMGREHIGALVNTLAIAYVGTALPLLLLFYHSGSNAWLTINSELFATEIIRTMVGSIGLVFTVPITTVVALWLLVPKRAGGGQVTEKEKQAIEQASSTHSH